MIKNQSQGVIIPVNLGEKSYDIEISSNILPNIGSILAKLGLAKKVAVVTNPAIGDFYYETVRKSIEEEGIGCFRIDLDEGEENKNFASLQKIYSELLAKNYDRRSVLIALGGGIVGDITGFAAASFMRGIPFIQVPTSLLAMVDSSVGGKTGINLPEGKNLVGAFNQPKHVLIDTDILKTLPKEEFEAGMAEVIKYAFISKHGNLINRLQDNAEAIKQLDPTALRELIQASCEIKAQVVAADETESKDIRSWLNFGHTFGHAVEAITEYKMYRHGEAVSIGMVYAGILSNMLNGEFTEEEITSIRKLAEAYGLPTKPPEKDFDLYWGAMQHDKKAVDGAIKFALVRKTGEVYIEPSVPYEPAREAYNRLIKG